MDGKPAIPTGITATATVSKPWWKSRTLWVQSIGFLVTILSGAAELDYVKAHLKEFAFATFALNTALRLFTTQGIAASSSTGATVTTVQPDTQVEVKQ